MDGVDDQAEIVFWPAEPIGDDFAHFERDPAAAPFAALLVRQGHPRHPHRIEDGRLAFRHAHHLWRAANNSGLSLTEPARNLLFFYLVDVNPNGGIGAAFADGWRRHLVVVVMVMRAVRRLILDVEPQVGLVHFAAARHFVGEFKVHRLHALGGRRFRPFQGLPDVRHWGKKERNDEDDWNDVTRRTKPPPPPKPKLIDDVYFYTRRPP